MAQRKIDVKQSFLALVFAGILLINFGLVGLIAYEYEADGQSDETVVFQTDVETTYPEYQFGLATGHPDLWTKRTSEKVAGTLGVHSTYEQYNYTPAFLGNDTWAISIPTRSYAPDVDFHRVDVVMDLPNLDNFIITHVDINLSLPGDADQYVTWAIAYTEIPIVSNPADISILELETPYNNEVEYIGDVDVPLTESVKIWDGAQQNNIYMFIIEIGDTTGDGMTGWAFTWSVTITGRKVTGWTINDSLSVALGVGVVMNVLAVAYMSDELDIGGYVKDIRQRQRRRRR